MLRLAKYIRPYLLWIVLDIVLLFGQANADLALPDYLSKIVNIGIQQGGVENAVPQAILQSEMDKLLLFMNAEDKATVLADYTLIDKSSPDYEKYLEIYPALEDEPIYVLNEIDKAEMEELNAIMAKPLLIVSALEQAAADPAKAAELGQQMGFDLSKIPPGTDIFALLGQLPADQFSKISAAIDRRFATMRRKHDHAGSRQGGRCPVRETGDGYQLHPDPIHPANRGGDAADHPDLGAVHDRGGVSLRPDCRRHGEGCAPRPIRAGRELFQHRVR